MNVRIIMLALVSVLGLRTMADATWTYNSGEPTWWFTESAWSTWPVSGVITFGSGNKAGERTNVYLQDGDVTLDELLDGFTAAGYTAREIDETDYNVALDIPVPLIRVHSNDERLAFDFTAYATPDDLKSGNPTVRALVWRAKVEKSGPGLKVIIR